MCWFLRRGPVPEEQPLGARTRTNNKLNPHMTPSPGVEPGSHWWEANALTTAPSLLPRKKRGYKNMHHDVSGYDLKKNFSTNQYLTHSYEGDN